MVPRTECGLLLGKKGNGKVDYQTKRSYLTKEPKPSERDLSYGNR
jgi:hypothetical protein